MTTQEAKIKFSRLIRPVAVLAFFVLLFGLLPVWSMMLGYQFVPATDWVSRVHLVATIVGVALAVIFLLAESSFTGAAGKRFPRLRRLLGLLVMPLIGFSIGSHSVTTTWPMVVAISVGHEVEIPFTVINASGKGDHRCRRPIDVEGLPFGFDSICVASEDFRQTLVPGSRIVVVGRGSQIGVFADLVRRIN